MASVGIFSTGILFATALVVVVTTIYLFFHKKQLPLPPGPRGIPLLGNVLDLPPKGGRDCEHWLKFKDTYGPISSITVLGTTFVILHSPELTSELLENRSSKYSSRPSLIFAEANGWSDALTLMKYDKAYRRRRKITHTLVGTKMNVAPYLPLQDVEVHRFLFRTLQEPERFLEHIKTEAAAFILKLIYGYTVEPHKPDPLVELVDEAMTHFSATVVPGAWLVDSIPALRYIPEWMLGGGWKKTARAWRAVLRETVEKPLQFARQHITSDDQNRSFVRDFYDEKGAGITSRDQEDFKWAATTLYGGGADTTVNTISAFFLAMILFPDVQRKAQDEIDRVVGTHRLPTFDDRKSLPYIEALLTEAWRWHSVGPLGVPHASSAEDIVNGYRIPKGSIIVSNIWWYTHDPSVYTDPYIFNPERFMGPNPQSDPVPYTFGYGRRICPGRFIADSSVWLTIVRSLAVFNISKGLDENGRETEPNVQFLPGLISRPADFKATIKPRSPEHEALIRQLEELHPWEESNAAEIREMKIQTISSW
ncbi:cytochrome protein [Xylaria bambusicola]|uniref:cytochrome protein n=1 Tax=Xylaria bambusicola TaxID=326684 RepID=UPI0020080B12|nr:cytochrome protein [Xylaria bambusicola]KAI0521821.1 cytochrome protein [Xylaria bambusicola]